MLPLISFILFIAGGVIAQFDPTITSATDITETIYTTPPLSPSDPDYVDEDLNLNTDEMLQKRTPPSGIYLCTHSNWTGECRWQTLQNNVCLDFPWDAAVSIGVST